MKTESHEAGLVNVAAPAEARRGNLQERRAFTHQGDPTQHGQHSPGSADQRKRVEAGVAPQRNRARLTEPRTAEHCHIRTPRRAADEGS